MTNNKSNDRYLFLAQKWVEGTISEEELQEYVDWLKELDPDAIVNIPPQQAPDKPAHQKKIYQQLQAKIKKEKRLNSGPAWNSRLLKAAVFGGLVVLGFISYYLITKPSTLVPDVLVKNSPTDIEPGTNGAVLTLANGKVIILDTAANGTLDNNVMKNQDALVFESAADGNLVHFNTLSTPRARQQQLVLPDGSRIWLNAESSIRFPTAFTGNRREIDITGEVYFEIAPDKTKPFVVNALQASVEVLGTHFNIMAYPNEQYLETTLLEGSIRYQTNHQQLLLKPGEQARTKGASPIELVRNADLEYVMAWKNGFQSFRGTDINTILRQITRWYDVDIVYEQSIPSDITFSGDIPREVTLSQLLKALESKQLHFTLDAPNKKVLVQFDL